MRPLATEPCERPARQVDDILRQAVHHDHEDICANGSEDVPPAVELQHETPGHSHSTFPYSQLGTVDEVELPEKVAEQEASCELVSLASEQTRLLDGECNTYAEQGQSLKISLILNPLDTLVDERPCSTRDKKDEEQESEFMYHMLVHVAVIERLDADGANQDERNIARILLRLSKRQCAVEAARSRYLHGRVVGCATISMAIDQIPPVALSDTHKVAHST